MSGEREHARVLWGRRTFWAEFDALTPAQQTVFLNGFGADFVAGWQPPKRLSADDTAWLVAWIRLVHATVLSDRMWVPGRFTQHVTKLIGFALVGGLHGAEEAGRIACALAELDLREPVR